MCSLCDTLRRVFHFALLAGLPRTVLEDKRIVINEKCSLILF